MRALSTAVILRWRRGVQGTHADQDGPQCLCPRQFKLDGRIMFSTWLFVCPSVRPSVRLFVCSSLVNTMF